MAKRDLGPFDEIDIVDVRALKAEIDIRAGDGPTAPVVTGPSRLISQLTFATTKRQGKKVLTLVNGMAHESKQESVVTAKNPYRYKMPTGTFKVKMTVAPGTVVVY
jgi:hypothetical protein